MEGDRISICVIAHNAYGALAAEGTGHVGGAENRTGAECRWFAGQGHEVSLITWYEGSTQKRTIDRVAVHPTCGLRERVAGVAVLSSAHDRVVSSDEGSRCGCVLPQFCRVHDGLAAWWCRTNGRRLIYSVAFGRGTARRNCRRWGGVTSGCLYRYGLRRANRVIVQTDHQRKLLKESFRVGP